MTDKIALYTAIIITLAVLADIIFNSGTAIWFLARKGDQFMEWIAFWR